MVGVRQDLTGKKVSVWLAFVSDPCWEVKAVFVSNPTSTDSILHSRKCSQEERSQRGLGCTKIRRGPGSKCHLHHARVSDLGLYAYLLYLSSNVLVWAAVTKYHRLGSL